ncbi:MAG: hypothetical protein B6D35_02835 [Candidatus Brocadia sp. UTAMX2]|jgi:hypothetical protein|nr:MAG: hypothetical protein B6D35_02835 [Candidatus Brocadia sp. UTAMX2]
MEIFEQDLWTNYSQCRNYVADWGTMPDFLQNRINAIAKEVDAAVGVIIKGIPCCRRAFSRFY